MATTGKRVLVIVAIVVSVVCFVTGLLIGWFLLDGAVVSPEETSNSTATPSRRLSTGAALGTDHSTLLESYLAHADPTVSARLIREIQASNIERHLR